MRKLMGWVTALAVICATGLSTEASILGKYLTFDGAPDDLVGISRASIFDGDGSLDTSVGDVIYGFVSISDTDLGDPSPDEIAVLFAAQILDSTVDGGGNTVFRMGAVDPTTNAGANASYTLSTLINDAGLSPQVDPSRAPAGASASDALGVVVTATGINPLSPELGSLADFAPAGFAYEATLGFDPASTLSAGDFLQFQPLGVAGIVGGLAGGFSIFDDPFGSSVIYLPVDAARFDTGASTPHDISLFNGVIFDNTSSSSPWDFTGASNFQLNAVPEPASVATWSLLAFAGLVALRIRRKK